MKQKNLLKKQKGFTLAETLITLTILGIVAAITVPALVNRHIESERRTKLRKAMSVYDTALNKMVIENGIKSDTALTNWADSNTKNDCANISAYFKVSRNLEVNGNTTNCKFRAPDGVFWDISNIKKPLVALREQDLNDETAQSDTNRAFYMFGWFDEQGSLRSNDMGKISAVDKADLQKLYGFMNSKTKIIDTEITDESNIEPESTVTQYSNFGEGMNKYVSGEITMKQMISGLQDNYNITISGTCNDLSANSFTTFFSKMLDAEAYAAKPSITGDPALPCKVDFGNTFCFKCKEDYTDCVEFCHVGGGSAD